MTTDEVIKDQNIQFTIYIHNNYLFIYCFIQSFIFLIQNHLIDIWS